MISLPSRKSDHVALYDDLASKGHLDDRRFNLFAYWQLRSNRNKASQMPPDQYLKRGEPRESTTQGDSL